MKRIFSAEMQKQAKECKTPDELLDMALNAGINMTKDEAVDYFTQLNTKTGQLSDDELDNVAGGWFCGNPLEDCPNCGSDNIGGWCTDNTNWNCECNECHHKWVYVKPTDD